MSGLGKINLAVDVVDDIAVHIWGGVHRKDGPVLTEYSKITHHSNLAASWHNGLPLSANEQQFSFSYRITKRLFDIVISLGALAFFLPLLILTALAIKLTSRGPVLFCQTREGLNGQMFCIWKFRTMAMLGGATTWIGSWLRKTSIDELPQLLNVLRGDMSLVGPRPHIPSMVTNGFRYDVLVPYYSARLAMRPGITGWAQANGYRGQAQTAALAIARVEHDIAYLQNASLKLDLVILFRTVQREFLTGTGS